MRAVGPEILGRWSVGKGPLYKLLAEALRTGVARGDIPVDTRLPAERVLAERLNVSRSTVVNAYDLLFAEGLLDRRQGSGTWVAPQNAAAARRAHLGQVWVPQAALRTIVDNPGNVVPFTASTVDRLTGDIPIEAFELDVRELFSEAPYFEVPAGLQRLREAIAARYEERGLPTSPEQVIVTSGAQQAISLIASAHLSAGDLALIESPTFPGAIDALGLMGARLRGIPVTRDGADVTSIERTVVQGHVALTYLIPSFQNPTGSLMPSSKRAALAEILTAWDVPMIDDESLVDLSLGAEAPPPLAAFAPRATVYTVGSLSKLFWGGLRIGWVRCPDASVGPLMRLKSVSDLSSSLVSQTIALKLLDHREEMVTARREQLTDRLQLFRTLLSRELPQWTFDDPAGGLSLWVDTGIEGGLLAQAALREGVAIVTAAETAIDHTASTYIRLPLALDHDVIEIGIKRLARAHRALVADPNPPKDTCLVV